MFQTKTKISRRFFVALVLIAVIPTAIMGYVSHVLVKKALTASAFMHVATIAEDHARHLDAWLKERLNDIGVLSRLPAIREACEQYCITVESEASSAMLSTLLKDTLTSTQERSPSYESIYVMSLQGQVLASTHPVPKDFSDSQRVELLERLKEKEEPVFGPLCQLTDKRWHVELASPIRASDGRRLAFIVAVLDVTKTIDPVMTDRIGLGESGETYLVNRDGQIISESRFLSASEVLGRSFDTLGIRSVLNRQKGTAVYRNYMGREVLGSFLWLPPYDWGILAEIGTDEILWPLKWLKTIGILTAFFVSSLCLLMAYLVSKRVAGPITQVADAARKIADGQLDQRIPFTGRDEVGMLASSFNTMARQVSQLIQSLHRKEESLQKAYDELVAAQDQLVQSEKMAAIGELVACVAHEMRSPLTSVKLNLQIIGRELEEGTVLHEHYEIALDQVGQMEKMFSDLLNYSKPLNIMEDMVHMADLIDRSLQQLESEVNARGVHILRNVSLDAPPIRADADKVLQVLVNILRNAVEVTRHGGRIEISAGQEKSGAGSMVDVVIADEGPGISQRNLGKIFQPFFTTKKKGTGLGLCIVKKIMEAHRGMISVSSEEGKGTRVRLSLPTARSAL